MGKKIGHDVTFAAMKADTTNGKNFQIGRHMQEDFP